MINGKVMNGTMLLESVRGYITAVNNGNIPNIEQIWDYACKESQRKAF